MIHLDVDGPYFGTGFAARLAAATDPAAIPDTYGEGPAVQACEAALAQALGKERAVLFATGTLANLLALDRLCGPRARRVLLHPESHVWNDTGDSLATVAGLTGTAAIAVGAGFAADAVHKAAGQAKAGKVAQALGAVCIETPVRRMRNALFPEDQLAEVRAAARAVGAGLHLDGARLPIAAAAQGKSMAAYAADYDTVYLSLWKMFGLPFGAVLAGSAKLLDGIEHDRRRLGGALPQFWPLASVVSAELGSLEPNWRASFVWLAELHRARAANGLPVQVEVGDTPANAFWLIPRRSAADYKARCRAAGIALGDIEGDRVLVRVNPSVLSAAPNDVAARLAAADLPA